MKIVGPERVHRKSNQKLNPLFWLKPTFRLAKFCKESASRWYWEKEENNKVRQENRPPHNTLICIPRQFQAGSGPGANGRNPIIHLAR